MTKRLSGTGQTHAGHNYDPNTSCQPADCAGPVSLLTVPGQPVSLSAHSQARHVGLLTLPGQPVSPSAYLIKSTKMLKNSVGSGV
jgi:hypothetical protein